MAERKGAKGAVHNVNDEVNSERSRRSTSKAESRAIQARLDKEFEYRRKLQQKYNIADTKQKEQLEKELSKFRRALDMQERKEDREARKADLKFLIESGQATKADKQQYAQMRIQDDVKNLVSSAISNIGNIVKDMTNKVDGYIGVVSQYSASVNTRLQESGKTYDSITKLFSGKLFGSPFVKQTEVLEKLSELVDKGIAYNVEQRAFLSSMRDKMVTTFDVTSSALLRIVRLQQADSTVARMGMESILNKYLNATYQDTSYLTDTFDTVEDTLVDAISQLGLEAGVEFEYVVQKWLGSLSSVGMSQKTLVELAEGINYLATGNIDALAANQSLQNLLVMGSKRAGLSYSDMLQRGLSPENLDALFSGIIQYGQELAQTENMVVKSQYANLFGLSLSDMTALLQMGDDLAYVIKQTLGYSDAVHETEEQLRTVKYRMSTAELIQNVFDNVMFSAATGLANNAAGYATWLVTNLVEQATGGINIPSISAMVMGTGVLVDLNTTVTQLMKTGLIGASLLGQIGNIVSGLGSGGALSLSGWNASDYTARGTGFTGVKAGVSKTTSSTATVGNSGGQDIIDNSITQKTSEATQSVEGVDQQESEEMMEEIRSNVASIASIMSSVFDGSNSIRVTVQDYGLTGVGKSGL